MTQSEIARKHNVSRMFVCDLKKRRKKTTNMELAKSMAELTGKKPIDFISEKLRDVYRKFYDL